MLHVVLQVLPSGCVSVVVTVFAPRVVSGVPPLRCMWCVAVVVVVLHVVYAAMRGTVMWCDDVARATGRGTMMWHAQLRGA